MTELRSRVPVYVPMTFVLLIAGTGMVRTLTQHWREGAVLLGGALIVAAVLRLLLPTDRVGLLAIRSRPIDVLCYGGLGTVIAVLAMTITASLLNGG
ncbi:DUF3017 domain-containing protein [Pseudonocardia sp. DSM 110487]|jgi:hypothetical protein|uniref:DUF3017 domain-containing protein n=1 Tax=Pseudonocardia sp. DSM 110487 TaxID=2865833 RepID=UPI001C6A0B1F|nr:DUF3017 domain-containing protein [Pseudonocardia sp. DSM 110487]QYN34980.1 DUF3017 domain-containing protein [Pseudonocardia sp. DSM 110487]